MVKQYKRLFVKQLYGNINARTGSLLQSYLHDIAIDFVGERIGEADDVEGIRETVVANASREGDVFQFDHKSPPFSSTKTAAAITAMNTQRTPSFQIK